MQGIPSTAFSVVAFFVLVLPGLVYAAVRTTLQGFRSDDKNLETRIAQALTISAVLDSVYAIGAYSFLRDVFTFEDGSVTIDRPQAAGIAVLVGAVAIPALLACSIHLRVTWIPVRRVPWLKHPVRVNQYRSTPAAWDWGVTRPGARFVRVRWGDGQWIGGLFEHDSYASTYPEPRDLYIRYQYEIKDDGSFGNPVPGTRGVWLRVSDDCIVEWLDIPPEDDE